MKSFSNEALHCFFRIFWGSYILDLAKTVRALRILSHKSTRNFFFFFFPSGFSFTTIHESQDCREKGEDISLTPLYHFHPLHRGRNIGWAITPEGSPLHIGSRSTRTGNLSFLSASRR